MDEFSVDVGNGRALGYREYGAPDGRPVVNCHGGLLCGLDVASFGDAASDLGVRIISPDCPGIASSDPAPGRNTADWAGDVRALLDHLDITQSGVLGWSMGGQYALACAALLHGLITRTVVIAGAVPEEASAIESLPDPGIAEAGARAMEHGEGMVEEYRAWVRPWGFTPEDVRGPVTIWQGDADELVPPSWGDELARRIPDAGLEVRAGEGHFLGYLHQADILRAFTE